MAQDYVVLKENSVNGMMSINKSVFQSIAEISIDDIEEAIKLTNTFPKPVQVKIIKNKLTITADVKIRYGTNVNAVCELIQNKIYENISYMTGFKPSEITVNVVGFEF